jgi:hypothetical protein
MPLSRIAALEETAKLMMRAGVMVKRSCTDEIGCDVERCCLYQYVAFAELVCYQHAGAAPL